MSYVLYPRQEEVVAKMEDFIKSKSKAKPVFIAPVAFGKSLLIANLALRVEDYYFINICPNKELLEQNYEKYVSYGNEASICSHSLGKKELGKVTFATIGTIDKFYSFYQNKKVVIVVDEAHLNSLKGSSLDTFIKRLPYVKVLGLTATGLRLFPTREGTMLQMMNKMYNCIFTMIGDVVQVKEVIKLNMWTPLSYRVENVDLSKLRYNTSGGDFTVKSLKLYSERNDIPSRCVAGVKSLVKEGRKTILIFVPSIADAEKIQSKLPNAVCVHSKTDKTVRKRAVESFKNGDLQVLVNVNCLDKKTEILTETGWVGCDEINYNHKVANWKNGEIYFEKPLKIVKKEISDSEFMCSYSGKAANFRVTNNHNMLARKISSSNSFKKIKAEDMLGKKLNIPLYGTYIPPIIKIPQEPSNSKNSYKKRVNSNSHYLRKTNKGMTFEESKKIAKDRIQHREDLKYKNPDELTINDCFLIGFFIGDGCKSKGNGSYRYSIAQSQRYPKIIEKINSVLKSCNIHHNISISSPTLSAFKVCTWNLSTGTGFGPQSKKGVYPLIPYLDKDGSKYLKYLTKEQFESFLYGLWMADGNHGDGFTKKESVGRGKKITSSNLNLLSLLQEISVCRGIKSSIRKESKPIKSHYKQTYKFSFSNSQEHLVNYKTKMKKEDFKKETVWCVQTTSGNLVTRRNYKPVIMGNCFIMGLDCPRLSAIIMARPTSSYTIHYQSLGRGVRKFEGKEDCVVLDLSGNYNKFGGIDKLKYENKPEWGGWAAFCGKELITDTLLSELKKPTKKSLRKHYKAEMEQLYENDNINPIFKWGKYKGKEFKKVKKMNPNSFKGYITWILTQHQKGEFILSGEHGKELIVAIERELKL